MTLWRESRLATGSYREVRMDEPPAQTVWVALGIPRDKWTQVYAAQKGYTHLGRTNLGRAGRERDIPGRWRDIPRRINTTQKFLVLD